MKVLITGASGLIGTALAADLEKHGHTVLRATREPSGPEDVKWDVDEGFADEDLGRLEGLDAVVHLAGESISGLRWTDEKKRLIRESRVNGTRSLVDALSRLDEKPEVLVSGSAVGFYGDRGNTELSESSPAGDTFLADTCKAWEAESRRAEDLGIRTVLLRTGIVLSKDGGALATMIRPFSLGVGGVIGSGKQWMSWIALEDIVRVIRYAIDNDRIRGAINAASPNPVTNADLTAALGKALWRPTFIPLPEFAVHLMFGEMGDALLLDSTRVLPRRLTDAGFKFRYPDLEGALKHALA